MTRDGEHRIPEPRADFDPLFIQNAPPRDFRVARAGHQVGYSLAEHTHFDDQVIFSVDGLATVLTQRSMFVIVPGVGLLIPAGTPHSFHIAQASRTLAINVPRGLLGRAHALEVFRMSDLLEAAIEHIASSTALGLQANPLLLEVLADNITSASLEPLRLPLPMDPRARAIVNHLIRSPGRAFGLDQFADMINTSRRTIERIFLAETGLDFRTYRQRARVYASLSLLMDGQSVGKASFSVGYASQASFTHVFKTTMGMTPKEFFSSHRRR